MCEYLLFFNIYNADIFFTPQAIADTYSKDGVSTVIFKMLKISEKELLLHAIASSEAVNNVTGTGSGSKGKKNPVQMHGSLLVQSILQLPGDCGNFINDRSVLLWPFWGCVVWGFPLIMWGNGGTVWGLRYLRHRAIYDILPYAIANPPTYPLHSGEV